MRKGGEVEVEGIRVGRVGEREGEAKKKEV